MADDIGMSPRAYDLSIATLRRLAFNGIGIFLLTFGAHNRTPKKDKQAIAAQGDNVIQFTAPDGGFDQFMLTALLPVSGKRAEWADVYSAYLNWCEHTGHRELGERDFGKRLMAFCEAADIGLHRRGGKVWCMDVNLDAEQLKIGRAS